MSGEWDEESRYSGEPGDWYDAELPYGGDPYGSFYGGSSYGDRWSSVAREGAGLVRVTVLHGTVVDVEYPRLVGSPWEHLDDRLLPRRAAPPPPPSPQPPAHELRLAWLERIVGGVRALAELDDVPLGPDPAPDLACLSWPVRTRLDRILDRVDALAPLLLGAEGAIVARRLAVRAVVQSPSVLGPVDRDQATVGAIIHAAGKGNDLVGPTKQVLAKEIQGRCGLGASPAQRARAFATAVNGGVVDWPAGWQHRSGPDVLVLGCPDLLVSGFRRQLLRERDVALRLREVTPALTG